jgi:hypothetical protein
MYITRADRWKSVIDTLKYGVNPDREIKQIKKNNKFVYIEGRKITPKDAYLLSGICPQFFNKYIGKEVPVEDIMDTLDAMWTRKKVREMKMESILK